MNVLNTVRPPGIGLGAAPPVTCACARVENPTECACATVGSPIVAPTARPAPPATSRPKRRRDRAAQHGGAMTLPSPLTVIASPPLKIACPPACWAQYIHVGVL